MKIGVLLAQSNAFPHLGRHYIDGVRMGFAHAGPGEAELKIEGIGLGGDKRALVDKAQKLVLEEQVDVLVGLVGHTGNHDLKTYLDNLEVPLVASDLGATFPDGDVASEWAFGHSLELANSAYITGMEMLKSGKKTIEYMTCYYDAGYHFALAMEHALYKNGGEYTGHSITPLHPRENEAEIIAANIEHNQPDLVMSVNSGLFATEAVGYMAKADLANKYAFSLSPVSVDREALKKHNITRFESVATWFPELDNPHTRTLCELVEDRTGKHPTLFHMMGFEVGMVLGTLEKEAGKPLSPFALRKALAAAKVEGPRGEVSFEGDFNRANFDHYRWTPAIEGDAFVMKQGENLGAGKAFEDDVRHGPQNAEMGGWNNPYLCH